MRPVTTTASCRSNGWRKQVRFGRIVSVPPMDERAVLLNDPLDCYLPGMWLYSGAVIDSLVLGSWPVGTRFKSGNRIYEVQFGSHGYYLIDKTPPVN